MNTKKFLFNVRRKIFYVIDLALNNGVPDRTLQKMYIEAQKPHPWSGTLTDVLIICYRHGAFNLPDNEMRDFIMKSKIGNFEKVKALKEFYLIET